MRFIISELPYEQPLAKGRWLYEKEGAATGAVEHWRLSLAHDGFQFLRVDLDARLAPSGRSYLFHALLDDRYQPVRLQYRLWQGNAEIIGNVHLEKDAVLFTSGQGKGRIEEMISVPAGYKFWFPSSIALGLLAKSHFAGRTKAVALVVSENKVDGPALVPLVTSLEKIEPASATTPHSAQKPVQLYWENQQRSIWLDASGWPVRMERQDGLAALETQLVTYQRISKPGEKKQVP